MAGLESIKGIGEQKAKLLKKLDILSLTDLLYFLPRDYHDYSAIIPIAALEHAQDAAVRVRLVSEPKALYPRKGFSIVTVQAQDETGGIQLVWYNQPYRKKTLKNGSTLLLLGRVDREKGVRLVNPELGDTLDPPGILPVYPLTSGLTQRAMRLLVRAALKQSDAQVQETLPERFRREHSLAEVNFALQNAHFPISEQAKQSARYRLLFEEALMFVLALKLKRIERETQSGIGFRVDENDIAQFVRTMPFELTRAQLKAIDEIAADMRSERPMNRILQGDVGSGKTVLALFVLYVAYRNGFQGALMAPTEILALQHEKSVLELFKEDEVLFMRGGLPAKQRAEAMGKIASGEARIIVGTHSLLQKDVAFERLGVVIADEQHRFGVRQRAAIAQKGPNPDVLIMSATPIPRTLSLVLYGDLDVSVLDGLPPGRSRIRTYFVPSDKRSDMYSFIAKRLDAGDQAYIVCPLVEQSEEITALSAKELYDELSAGALRSCRIELLYGKQKAKDKQDIIEAFGTGECQALVSTSVVEVGVNVPNATIMVVEDADRFGLAQLHQLRGRVGRGSKPSGCFLLSRSQSESTIERIALLTKTNNGFEIAQHDLELRGPGDFLGTKQHGAMEFKLLRGATMDIIKNAQDIADSLFEPGSDETERETLLSLAKNYYHRKTDGIALN